MENQNQDDDGVMQQGQEHERPILVDENPRNRPRYDLDDDDDANVMLLKPLDPELNRSAMMINTRPISLAALMEENHASIPRKTRIDLQLLRVIANANTGANQGLRVYGASRANRGNSSTLTYSRLMLCKIVCDSDDQGLVYVMESRNTNNKLWSRNPQLRDDGEITIGSIIRFISPLPIKTLMAQDIPMLETRFPVVVMKNPIIMREYGINMGMTGNKSQSFVLNHCTLDVISSTPEETKCSGLFCDKQRIHEIANNNQGCGCYSMLTRRSNMIIDHSLKIEKLGWECYIENFSSTRFSRLYQNAPFPSAIRADSLQLTDDYWNLSNCISNVIDFINENGGFTIIGWYKRGVINDQSIITGNVAQGISNNNTSPDNQIDNGEMNFHPCFIQPTNRQLLDCNSLLGRMLRDKKFDVSVLNQL